jgi:hypothetical protein
MHALAGFGESQSGVQGSLGITAIHFKTCFECPGVGYSRSMASFDSPCDGFVA